MSTFYPTLVIGLGGTGKAILQDIRSRMLARFGSFKDLPVIGFLALDTDPAEDKTLKTGSALDEALTFGAAEQIHLKVEEGAIKAIRTNLGTGQYPYLETWLDGSVLKGPIMHGAGAIRQRGRLALYENMDRVVPAINNAVKQVMAKASETRTATYLKGLGLNQFEIQPGPVKIFIVASLIGGTGSGIFLDVGYLLREKALRVDLEGQAGQTIGILVLPLGAAAGDGIATRSSSYAALQELNHFSDDDQKFSTAYKDGRKFDSSEPPFDFQYLVTGNNDKKQLTSLQLVRMIGQRIFLEATNEFANKIYSVRDNIKTHCPRVDGRNCNQYFFTFGLSTLEVPVRAIASACGARFLSELVSDLRCGRYAGRERELKIDPAALHNFLQIHQLSESQLKEEMLKSATGSLEKDIRSAFEACSTMISNKMVSTLRDLEKQAEERLTAKGGEGGTDGEYVALIQKNARNLSGASETHLTRLITDLAHQPEGRLLYARKFLGDLKEHFERLKNEHTQKAETAAKRMKAFQSNVNRARAELAEIVGDPLLSWSFWQKGAYADAFSQRYGRHVMALNTDRLVVLVGKAMNEYLSNLLRVMQELSQKTEALDLYLENLEKTLRELAQQAEQTVVPVNGQLLYTVGNSEGESGEVDQTYARIFDSPERRRKLLDLFYDERIAPLLVELDGQRNVFRLHRSAAERTALVNGLWRQAAGKIMEWAGLDRIKVLDRFFEDPHSETNFKAVARLSAKFLQINIQDPHFSMAEGAKEMTVVAFEGGATAVEQCQRTFTELCQQFIPGVSGHESHRLSAFDDPAQAVFYSEFGAFPIRLWRHIQPLKEAYEIQLRENQTPVHLFRRDFPLIPIVKLDTDAIQRMAAIYLVAKVAKVFTEVRERNRTFYEFSFDDGGRRREIRLQDPPEVAAEVLMQAGNESVVRAIESRLVLEREKGDGDRDFVELLLLYRNDALRETDTKERKQLEGLLDLYLQMTPGLEELVDEVWQAVILKRSRTGSGATSKSAEGQAVVIAPVVAVAPPFCPGCGAKAVAGVKFCGECGGKLGG